MGATTTCTDCRGGCPTACSVDVEQPPQAVISMADAVFVRAIGPLRRGHLVPQHSHVHDHMTLVGSGAVRAWQGGILLGDFPAPTPIFIKAGALHRFQALEDGTTLFCIHNTGRTGQVEELEQGRLPPEPPLEVTDDGDGITLQEEAWDRFWRDGQALVAAHTAETGPRRDGHVRTWNLPFIERVAASGALQVATARCNGRMAGYLVSVLNEAFDVAGTVTAVHTAFYVHPDFRGIGPRLMRSANAMLREKGVSEVMLRVGLLAAGPKAAALYRRLGAIYEGEFYVLKLGGN